jgi:predicted anti-sigma-YlaC factor YlaD
MINCVHFRAQWSEYEKLDPTDTMRIRRHLSVCPRCRAYDMKMRLEQNIDVLLVAEESSV